MSNTLNINTDLWDRWEEDLCCVHGLLVFWPGCVHVEMWEQHGRQIELLSLWVLKLLIESCFQYFSVKKGQRKRYDRFTIHYFGKSFFLPKCFLTLQVFKLFNLWRFIQVDFSRCKKILLAHERPFRAEWWTCLLFKILANSGCTHAKFYDWQTPTLISIIAVKKKGYKATKWKRFVEIKVFIVIVQENKTVLSFSWRRRTRTQWRPSNKTHATAFTQHIHFLYAGKTNS